MRVDTQGVRGAAAWLNMSVETAESRGPPISSASNFSPPSRRKISTTAGNHFFFNACTTYAASKTKYLAQEHPIYAQWN